METVPQWGTADAKIEVPPPIKNPELTNVLPFKPGVGQNIAMHASPAARNFFLVLFTTFMAHSHLIFSQSSPYFLTVLESNN